MEKLSVLLLAGVTNGSVYGLIGLSIAIIYGASRVINFAQGEFIMLATMTSVTLLVTANLPAVVALPAVLLLSMLVGVVFERGIYRPLSKRGAEPIGIMIGILAGSIIINGAALVIWGPEPLYVPPVLSLDPIVLGPVTTNLQQVAIIASFGILLVASWFLLHRTQFGLCVRATGINARVALLMGIRSDRVVAFSFLYSAFISGISGILMGPLLGAQITMGLLLTVKGFMAAILGGLGSPFAAAAGGVAIGLLEALMAGYGTSLYAEPAIFVIILLVLLVRPYGLLGDYEAERR